RDRFGRAAIDAFVAQRDGARHRLDQAGYRQEPCVLSGPVGPDHDRRLAGFDRESEVAHHHGAVVPRHQPADVERRGHSAPDPLAPRYTSITRWSRIISPGVPTNNSAPWCITNTRSASATSARITCSIQTI